MSETYDCIVLGVGGFGSGVLYHLARRGVRAVGIERFDIAHDKGSSHGESRIIRKAYFEHPDYVPLLTHAFRMWEELEIECGEQLFQPCGLMLAGPPDGEVVSGAKLSAREHAVPIEELSLQDARRRFPGFQFPEGFEVVFEGDAGFLEVEKCVTVHIEGARARGAVLKTGETVTQWTSDGSTVRVETDAGTYEAGLLIATPGPWASGLFPGLNMTLEVVRKPQFWHRTTTRDYDLAAGASVSLFELPGGAFYVVPSRDGDTVKTSEHTGGDPVADPSQLDREVHPEDAQPIQTFLQQCVPGVEREAVRHSVCMYTHTPDRHFIVDRHPEYQNVIVGAGFSGHGFKFTGVLGEALAELALDGRSRHPIEFLAIDRDLSADS